ncbi:MAG: metal-transporting ATPase, partial [Emergencia sp.]
PKVTDIIPVKSTDERQLLSLAYALERKSEHPLARAINEMAEQEDIEAVDVEQFQALAGNGVKGFDGETPLWGGSLQFVGQYTQVPEELMARSERLSGEGKTPLFFARGGKLAGIIAVADVIKTDSPRAIKEMQEMGLRVVMLTGDNRRTADAIGAKAGVDQVIAGVLPDGKEKTVRELQREGTVIMVGDGINDAPALTRADIGIAIGAGADVAVDAADVVLMKSSLLDVPAAIRLSRATLRNIHQNLFWAFIYNVVGIPLAAGVFIGVLGWQLNPMFAAAAMSLSSFSVVTNALRLNLFNMYDSGRDHKIKGKLNNTVDSNDKMEGKNMVKTMKIEGMMCGHCEAHTKKALEALDAVEMAEVSHTEGTAVVTLKEEVPDDVLKQAVEEEGYRVIEIL